MKPLAYSFVILFTALATTVRADVKLPSIFSDHAVLLSAAVVPIWGWADAGEKVDVSFAGQTKSAIPDANGKWMVKLDALKADAKPQELTVKGKNTLSVKDVLIGEVWLGSGQSNMGLRVNQAKDFEQEKITANLPDVRMFTVSSVGSAKEEEDCKGSWVVCTPQTVGSFSATLYFFGREIHKTLGVPTGLINSSVGGTAIELWMAPEVQQAAPELKTKTAGVLSKPAPQATPDADVQPARKMGGALFNGKIAPLIPYAIRGTIWYQGESNANTNAQFYQHQLPLLVTNWRKRWGSEFPFAWVQLPNFVRPGNGWPLVREAMLKTLKLPKTGMAITIDIGEEKNIHPKNKQEVGRRLSLWALGEVYGKKVPSTSGPLPVGQEVKANKIVVKFSHADGGLVAKDGALRGFMIAGDEKDWKPATGQIAGDTVIVSSPEIAQPVAVRYAWQDWPDCNLINGAGLPASPFRTDDWKN